MAAVSSTAQDFCRALLGSCDLPSKLVPPRRPRSISGSGPATGTAEHRELLPFGPDDPGLPPPPSAPTEDSARAESPSNPTRPGAAPTSLGFAVRPGRLPGLGELRDKAARIACLTRFAHHELQAIELFAWAILRFPELPLALRRGFLLVLEEEQEHLQLYLDRLTAHGVSLSSGLPGQASDYLWRHTAAIAASPDPVLAFLSAVGLTFEQANLDFAGMYRDAFRAAGDVASAEVLAQVHHDEIRHVRLAVRWLARLKRPDESELAAYLRSVPFPLSPARAKGRRFDIQARRQAGLSDELIAHVAAAQPYRSVGASVPEQGAASPSASRRPSRVGENTPEPWSGEGASSRLWLLPNLGGEEDDRPLPKSARGFLRGLHGAWGTLFPSSLAPWLLPPGDAAALAAWQTALPGEPGRAAFPELEDLLATGATSPKEATSPKPDDPLLAWINTPGAERQAHELRRELRGPSPSVVTAVHHKGFAQEQAGALGLLPACLAGTIAVLSADLCSDASAAERQVMQMICNWPDWLASSAGAEHSGERRLHFVLKPALGTSGRGRVHGQVLLKTDGTRTIASPLSTTAWVELSRRGGAILEPWLSRRGDYSVQLAIARPDGGRATPRVSWLATTTQVLTPSGQIRGNRGLLLENGDITLLADDPATADALSSALLRAALPIAEAAAARGYYGIAGIDAFTFVGPEGRPVLRPIVELNARFTTGTVAVGLLRRAQQAGLVPSGAGAWAFLLKAPRGGLSERIGCVSPCERGPALLWAQTAGDLDGVCTE